MILILLNKRNLKSSERVESIASAAAAAADFYVLYICMCARIPYTNIAITYWMATMTPMMIAFLQEEYPHTSGLNKISSIVPAVNTIGVSSWTLPLMAASSHKT